LVTLSTTGKSGDGVAALDTAWVSKETKKEEDHKAQKGMSVRLNEDINVAREGTMSRSNKKRKGRGKGANQFCNQGRRGSKGEGKPVRSA